MSPNWGERKCSRCDKPVATAFDCATNNTHAYGAPGVD